MGIITNALSIIGGVLLGTILKGKLSNKLCVICGISVIILSAVGFLENIFLVTSQSLSNDSLIILILALIIGYLFGEALKLEDKINSLSKGNNDKTPVFISTSLFFIVGGLEISGPILLALNGDNSMLYLKSLVDFPFAIIFGSLYGFKALLSAFPTALIQVSLFLLAKLCGDLIPTTCLKQLCALGYIILLFSGYNLLVDEKHKIKNTNMLPAFFLILIYNVTVKLVEIL
ncbi:MAG: DUF554 family protein [Clostridia bacterium]|nr:DUF554 family protein [Clostridia bacterium]